MLPSAQPAGPVRALTDLSGPPVGAVEGWPYTHQARTLAAGSVLIGFTDGLIERRRTDLDTALEALTAALDALPQQTRRDLEALVDTILDLPDAPSTDDIAILAVRIPAPTDTPDAPRTRR